MTLTIFASTTLVLSLIQLLSCVSTVSANTEIRNFYVAGTHKSASKLPEGWPILQYHYPEIEWSIVAPPVKGSKPHCADLKSYAACPHDLWVVLDFGHKSWFFETQFTLRLSWPASYPVDFAIEIVDNANVPRPKSLIPPPPSTFTTTSPSDRRKLARIRALNTAIPTPNASYTLGFPPFLTSEPPLSPLSQFQSTATGNSNKPNENGELTVPFILILEPLYLGFIPATVIPVLGALVGVVVVSTLMVPKVFFGLQEYASKARLEYIDRMGIRLGPQSELEKDGDGSDGREKQE